jgi:rod shape-determining protein MreD
MKLDFPVMAAALLVSAAAQSLMPPLHGAALALKLPILPAVALYYAMRRDNALGLLAALWAGILIDATGAVPAGTSSVTLALIAAAIIPLRQYIPEASALASGVAGVATVLLLAVVQYCALRVRTPFRAPPYLLLRPMATLLPLSFVVAPLVAFCLSRIDLVSGNVKPRKEVEGE